MTAGQTIDYETLSQEAMRGVVRTVLARAAKSGLPGDHHFYISFDTQAPGVALSKRLKEKYPSEMTIVLQHRFWDLSVGDDRFEVKLTFDGIPERLVIPFAAIKVFFDPSVRYGLQFEGPDMGPDSSAPEFVPGGSGIGEPAGEGISGHRTAGARSATPRKPRAPRKARAEKEPSSASTGDATPAATPTTLARSPHVASGTAASATGASSQQAAGQSTADDAAAKAAADKPASTGAQIVSLDAFRKK